MERKAKRTFAGDIPGRTIARTLTPRLAPDQPLIQPTGLQPVVNSLAPLLPSTGGRGRGGSGRGWGSRRVVAHSGSSSQSPTHGRLLYPCVLPEGNLEGPKFRPAGCWQSFRIVEKYTHVGVVVNESRCIRTALILRSGIHESSR